MANREYRFYAYILGSISGTLYIGMTNNIRRRVWLHKQHEIEGFTAKYGVDRLLYFESFDDVRTAINREKQYEGDRGPSAPLRSAQEDTETKSP